jgi:hypothetical protein
MSGFALMGSVEAFHTHDDEPDRAGWRQTPGMDRHHVACDALLQHLHLCLFVYELEYRSSGSDRCLH